MKAVIEWEIDEEDIVTEMINHDFVIKMPPKKKYKIDVTVRSIKKGEPRLVDPEEFEEEV